MSAKFINDVVGVLVKHNFTVVRTNTPLEVLAAHMLHSLQLFESTLIARKNHHFFMPGRIKDDASSQMDTGVQCPAPAAPVVDSDDPLVGGRQCPSCED